MISYLSRNYIEYRQCFIINRIIEQNTQKIVCNIYNILQNVCFSRYYKLLVDKEAKIEHFLTINLYSQIHSFNTVAHK